MGPTTLDLPGTSRPVGAHFTQPLSRRYRARRWLTGPGDGRSAVVLAALLVTLLSWRNQPWGVAVGGIDSWQTALALGFQRHLQWGPQAIFTFGPYGFVESIMPYGRLTGAIAVVYTLVVCFGVAAFIVSALRKNWGLVAATVVGWFVLAVTANLLESPEVALALALGLALVASRPDAPRWTYLTLGSLAGFQLLVEITVGLVTTGALVVALLARRQRNTALLAGALFVAVPVLALIAAGQDLTNIPSYLLGSLQVMLGYAGGMANGGQRGLENWMAVVDVALIVTTYATYLRRRPPVERALVGLFVIGWLWEAVKEGFVRHDLHDLVFFGLTALAACLVEVPRRALQAAALMITSTTLVIASAGIPPAAYKPLSDTAALAAEVTDLLLPSRWAQVQQTAHRQIMFLGAELPPDLVRRLQGHTMAAEPWEDSLAFAYPQLHWDPEPVLQAYSAYTPYLDQADAKFLASSAGPQRILYQADSLDNQDPYWMPPAATVAMVCNYAQIADEGGWLLLAKVPDRCGSPRLLATVRTKAARQVMVPRTSGYDVVFATISRQTSLTDELAGLALKPAPIWAHVWRGSATAPQLVKLIGATAGDPHLLRVAARMGWWAKAANISAMAVESEGPVEVRFYEVRGTRS